MAKNEKTFDEQNMRKIIRILSGLSASQQQLAEQCVNEYQADKTYSKDNICFYNGTLYRAKTVTLGNTPSPESTYFEMLDGVEEEIDAQYIETLMSTVSAETWDYMKNILSDQISTTHAWNSSTSYAQDQATLQSAKDYTDQQVSKSLSKSYVVVNDLSLVQEDKYIYLVEQGDGSYLSYVLGKDGNPISFGDPNNVNLEGYAKTEDIANEYAKSSDLDSKFATITTTDGLRTGLNNHTNDTVAHLTQEERDKLVTTDVLGDYAKTVDLPTPRTDDEIKTLADGQIESSKQVLQFSDLKGITADSTLDEVVRAVPGRKIAILQSASFTNYLGLPHQMYTITINSLGYNRMQVFATSKYSDHASYVGACDNSSGVDVYDKWIKVITDKHVTTTINSSSTDTQIPSAKSVYDNSLTKGISDANTRIPTDADLNDYITPGVYTCSSSSIAKTLLNCPHASSNFKMIINQNTGGTTGFYGYQMIVGTSSGTSNPCVYYRGIAWNGTSDCIYSPWKKVCTTSVSDVPLTNITFSDETNYKVSGTAFSNYEVRNGICYVSLFYQCMTPVATSDIVNIAQLPAPTRLVRTVVPSWSANNVDFITSSFANTNSEGNLYIQGGVAGKIYLTQFSYPVKES